MIKIQTIVNSVINSCTYILSVNHFNDYWLIDVGDIDKIEQLIGVDACVRGVFITHAHYDHIYGLNKLLIRNKEAYVYTSKYGLSALCSPKENLSKYHPEVEDFVFEYPNSVKVLEDNSNIELFKGVTLRTLYTPGHDISCLSYIVENNLFTGDSYIPGAKVVSSFPRSDKLLAKKNEQKLKAIESSGYNIFSGHLIG